MDHAVIYNFLDAYVGSGITSEEEAYPKTMGREAHMKRVRLRSQKNGKVLLILYYSLTADYMSVSFSEDIVETVSLFFGIDKELSDIIFRYWFGNRNNIGVIGDVLKLVNS